MKKTISKLTVDAAGQLYSQGITGGWNKVAEMLTAAGHVNSSGGYLHGQALCSATLADPQWAHLRKNKAFGSQKRQLIEQAILSAGYSKVDADKILQCIP
jgi:hypothetical protein